jgi:hypothetical protein
VGWGRWGGGITLTRRLGCSSCLSLQKRVEAGAALLDESRKLQSELLQINARVRDTVKVYEAGHEVDPAKDASTLQVGVLVRCCMGRDTHNVTSFPYHPPPTQTQAGQPPRTDGHIQLSTSTLSCPGQHPQVYVPRAVPGAESCYLKATAHPPHPCACVLTAHVCHDPPPPSPSCPGLPHAVP